MAVNWRLPVFIFFPLAPYGNWKQWGNCSGKIYRLRWESWFLSLTICLYQSSWLELNMAVELEAVGPVLWWYQPIILKPKRYSILQKGGSWILSKDYAKLRKLSDVAFTPKNCGNTDRKIIILSDKNKQKRSSKAVGISVGPHGFNDAKFQLKQLTPVQATVLQKKIFTAPPHFPYYIRWWDACGSL